MACLTGVCFTEFTDLCSFVGRSCINIEQTFGGLIENQFALASAIAPVIEGASEFPSCTRVYFDTATCTYTNSPSATTVTIGVHLFGGRVRTDGPSSCVTVQCTPGELPECGTFLDDDLCSIPTSEGAAYILLEDATNSGCTSAMRLPADPFDFYEGYFSNTEVPIAAATEICEVLITVPADGLYDIGFNGQFNNLGTIQQLEAWVQVNSDAGRTGLQVTSQSTVSSVARSFNLCLSAGDTLSLCVVNLGAVGAVWVRRSLQVRYEQECP